jgi:hypothetical protein
LKNAYPMWSALAHLPHELDARFAGADSRMNARFDQLSIRLHTKDRRLQQVEVSLANQGVKLDRLDARLISSKPAWRTRLPPKGS